MQLVRSPGSLGSRMEEAVSLFPSFSLSPTTRQTTRALQEIQAQRPGLLVLEGEGLAVAPVPVQPTDITDRVRWSVNLATSLDTPSPSPDELAIQARGRRRMPLTYSPDLISSPLSRHVASPTSRQQAARARLASLHGPQVRRNYAIVRILDTALIYTIFDAITTIP